MYVTLAFMMPLIRKMWFGIKSQNFCKFLALVNLVSYNFGYHVHEKAILMTYIPLLLEVKTDLDRARVKLIGFLMMFTFMPLIPGEIESLIKNCLLALHYL
jgi:ALG6, ALG8 glycosyltransferase family